MSEQTEQTPHEFEAERQAAFVHARERLDSDEKFGLAAEQERAGYKPMKMANPVKQPLDDELSREAVEAALRQDAQQVAEAIPIDYREHDTGKLKPPNEVVELEQAAHDIANMREAAGQQIESAQEQELAAAIDALRAGDTQQPALQQQASDSADQLQSYQQQQQGQPEHQAAQPDDEVTRLLESNPKLLQAVNENAAQWANYAEQARRGYEQAALFNANAALANLVADIPELQGCRLQAEVDAALKAVQNSNLQRHTEILHRIQRASSIISEGQRVQAEQQKAWAEHQQRQLAQAQQDFQRHAVNSDGDLEGYVRAQGISDDQFRELQAEARNMWNELGVSDQDLTTLWNTNSVFRSYPSQRVQLEAALWRKAQRGVKSKEFKSVPTVQRPGSPQAFGSQQEWDTRKLNDRLDRSTGREALKAAAELVAARRAARR